MRTDPKSLASCKSLLLALTLMNSAGSGAAEASTNAEPKKNTNAQLTHKSLANVSHKLPKRYLPLQWFNYIQRIGIGGPPSQAEPELRAFVTEIALRVRERWLAAHKPTFQPVYVSFYRDGQEIYVNADDDDDEQSRTAAEHLVCAALKGVKPPRGKTYQGYAVDIFFESYPDKKTPDPRLGEGFKIHTFEPAILYSDMLVSKIRSNWKSELPALKERESYDATVRISVNADGSLDWLKILSGSKHPDYDQTEVDAVKASFPTVPLPKGAPSKAAFDLLFMYEAPRLKGNAAELNFKVSLADPKSVSAEELHYQRKAD